MDLDKLINIYGTESNVFQQNPSTLIHTKDNAYKSREKYLLSFDIGKTYWEKFKLEEVNLYEKYSLQLGNVYESN